jgi:KAP family P-loop domain
MNQNKAALGALSEYVKIDRPGYAFMIEAPWGAGKTHLVLTEFKREIGTGDACYATLNGVKDRAAFHRSLLSLSSQAKVIDIANKLKSTLSF